MALSSFHPIIQQWFHSHFEKPTEPQDQGWPAIISGRHTLISAPTGSGKTLTAFLAIIDRLLKQSLNQELEEGIRVVYISPLRALSNDMHRNLEVPLAEITALAQQQCPDSTPIRVGLRTGDTKPSQRAALVRKPPHVLVTTPESLYLLLTSPKSRETLRNVETVIVDEIHALIRDKRGSHLALSLERLESLCEKPLQRIGLSATQKPIERVANFLVGSQKEYSPTSPNETSCEIIQIGHSRELDLAIEVPNSELGAVCTHEQWAEINSRISELVNQHRSTLIFVNTRRLAERVTHQLTELLGEESVSSHHGSLSAKYRLETERKLKSGELKAVVATASLELGIDIGYIDLVIQIGSPRSIATLLQRVGRSGHSLGLVPKGRLFSLTRDELMECLALCRAVRAGRLDVQPMPDAPIDILAQQIVAEVSTQEWKTDDLFDLCRAAYPYRNLTRDRFNETIHFLSEGLTDGTHRDKVYLHHDQVGKRVRPRKSARLTALQNGGAIPEIASYRVVLEPEQTVVGSVDEDFAIESMAGDVFLLGNTSWRIQHVRGGDVTVTDAHGAPPSIPFWFGEAPGRTLELSEEVSRLREDLESRVHNEQQAVKWLQDECQTSVEIAQQIVLYAAAQKAAIGLLPTQKRIVFERFFDESGGMQLVIHAPFGGDINRAWGYAMRKRFCRSYDFELQATADDDGVILSLGPQHSFPLESLFPMLNRSNARHLLEQAVLDQPLFHVRWRWNTTRALQVTRQRNGQKVPPALQRFRAEDLLTAVFPRLTGCQENVVGEIEPPDNILVQQTLHDCLHEPCDIDGLEDVLEKIEAGDITLVARDTREPSPFSYELLNSNPYAFLDGGEIQERRARAVSTRRTLTVESVSDLGRLDPAAIELVTQQAQPLIRNADELHDHLLERIFLPIRETENWQEWFQELVKQNRAAEYCRADGLSGWVAAERLPAVVAAFPEGTLQPTMQAPEGVRTDWTSIDARVAIVRGLIEISGPITADQLAEQSGITPSQAAAALESLEGDGIVLRGRFSESQFTDEDSDHQKGEPEKEWCHRRLLARIHRLTLEGLRREIQPVETDVYLKFLTHHHGLISEFQKESSNGLFEVLSTLQGLDIPSVCWERDILPGRIKEYSSAWLDELCLTGEIGWGRMFPPKRNPEKSKPMASLTRVAPISLFLRSDLAWLSEYNSGAETTDLSSTAEELLELLKARGALFAADLLAEIRLLPGQLEETLGELVSRGLVTADGFAGLRQLLQEKGRTSTRRSRSSRSRMQRKRSTVHSTGRWSYWKKHEPQNENNETTDPQQDTIEQWAWQLLRRWGVVFRDLLDREQGAPRWYQLTRIYRRLEARGEIRGGRFISGVGGEQFATGDTVKQLRNLRDQSASDELVVLSAADPVNLFGIITDDTRVPAISTNKVAMLNGILVAALKAGEYVELRPFPEKYRERVLFEFGLAGTALSEQFKKRAEGKDVKNDSQKNKTTKTTKTKKFPNNIPRPMIS